MVAGLAGCRTGHHDSVARGRRPFWKGIRDFPPTIWGKLSTVLQIAAALAIIAGVRVRDRSPDVVRACLRHRRRNGLEWFTLPTSRAAGYVFRIPLTVISAILPVYRMFDPSSRRR